LRGGVIRSRSDEEQEEDLARFDGLLQGLGEEIWPSKRARPELLLVVAPGFQRACSRWSKLRVETMGWVRCQRVAMRLGVILEECDGRAVVEDEGDRPVVLAWLARGQDITVDPVRPNNFCPIGVEPSFLLTVAEAELRALKSVTLSDGLLKGGVPALEGAGVLALTEVGPACDKRLVTKLAVPEGFDDTFIPEVRHEAPEGEVDGGSAGFTVDVRMDGVELPGVATFFIEEVPNERLVLVVLVDVFLKFAGWAGSITVHWSVG
jgi:hypothetical protein